MSHQYFEDNADLSHDYQDFTCQILGHMLNFKTDSGVFSRSALDFGSRTLLECLPIGEVADLGSGFRLLDLGCGYGPVGISLGKCLPKAEIDLVDINERAVTLARENASRNAVKNLAFYVGDAYAALPNEARYDWVITNPPIRAGKQVVQAFIRGAFSVLKPDGTLFLVIQKKQGAPSAKKKMAEVFGDVERICLNKGYWVLRAKKS